MRRTVDWDCAVPWDCLRRRWYGAGALPAPPCWQCPSYQLRYLARPTMPWAGQVVERTSDRQPYYPRWVE